MDQHPASRAGEEPCPETPFVVIFFRHGDGLKARVRNVASQEQWIVRDAARLRELLAEDPSTAAS